MGNLQSKRFGNTRVSLDNEFCQKQGVISTARCVQIVSPQQTAKLMVDERVGMNPWGKPVNTYRSVNVKSPVGDQNG